MGKGLSLRIQFVKIKLDFIHRIVKVMDILGFSTLALDIWFLRTIRKEQARINQ
jgi:hypothetical protein